MFYLQIDKCACPQSPNLRWKSSSMFKWMKWNETQKHEESKRRKCERKHLKMWSFFNPRPWLDKTQKQKEKDATLLATQHGYVVGLFCLMIIRKFSWFCMDLIVIYMKSISIFVCDDFDSFWWNCECYHSNISYISISCLYILLDIMDGHHFQL